jgi:hypothetical protein
MLANKAWSPRKRAFPPGLRSCDRLQRTNDSRDSPRISATADPDGHSVNPDLDDAVGLVPPTSALSLGRFTNALAARLIDDGWHKRRSGLGRRYHLTASPRSRDHFQPTIAVRPWLKRMVKRRHKPISDSEIAHP